jgi:MFS family permease
VYVVVLLVSLLFFGSVSDYLGRLPVIITALVFSAAGCAVFLGWWPHSRNAPAELPGLIAALDSQPDVRVQRLDCCGVGVRGGDAACRALCRAGSG